MRVRARVGLPHRERAALGFASRPELTPPSAARAAPFRAARRDAVRARYAARRAAAEQARKPGCEGEERHGTCYVDCNRT